MAFHLNAKVVCMDTVDTLVKVRCFYDLFCETLIFGMPRANLWFYCIATEYLLLEP